MELIHNWKEKLVISVSLILLNLFAIFRLFKYTSTSTLLFVEQYTSPIILFIKHLFLTIFIPGLLFSLTLFVIALAVYILCCSLWLFESEGESTIGKMTDSIYQLSFNLLLKSVIFFVIFSLVNLILFLFLGIKLGYYHNYLSYFNNPNNLTYFFSLLISNLLFIETEYFFEKLLKLPSFSKFFSFVHKTQNKKINISTSVSHYIINFIFVFTISFLLIFCSQFTGSFLNNFNLKIQPLQENNFFDDEMVVIEINVSGITKTGRYEFIPLYLYRTNKQYQEAEKASMLGNYLSAINLFQKELDTDSNFSASITIDKYYPIFKSFQQNKITSNILFMKDNLLENNEYNINKTTTPEDISDYIAGNNNPDYSLYSLSIDKNMKINIFRNSIGKYYKVFRKSDLIDLSQAHIAKRIGDCFFLLGNISSAKDYYFQALDKNKHSLEAKNNLGYLYLKENNFIKAEEEFNDILKILPDYTIAQINLSNLYLKYRQFDQALNILQKIDLKNNLPLKTTLFYYQTLAETFTEKKDYKRAEKIYLQALKASPSFYHASIGLADMYSKQGQLMESKKVYDDIIRDNPKISSAYIGLANIYIQKEDKKRSIKNFNRAIGLKNDYQSIRDGFIGLGKIYFQENNFSKAEDYFYKSIEIDPFYYLSYQELGKLYYKSGKLENAKNNLLKSLEMFSLNEEVQEYLDKVYKSINTEAQTKYEKIINKVESSREKQKVIYSYKNLGWLHLENKNYKSAEHNFKKALAIDPNYIEALQGLGALFFDTGKYDTSREIFEKIIGLNKKYPRAFLGLGLINVKLNKPNKAKEYFEQVLGLDDINSKMQANLQLGWLFYGQKKHSEAQNRFIQALKFKKDMAEAHYGLGRIYEDKKSYNNAKFEFQRALMSKPTYKQAREGLFRVNKFISEGMKAKISDIHAQSPKYNQYKKIRYYINNGELNKAKNLTATILNENPNDIEAIRFMGTIYYQEKNYQESKDQWEKILYMSPHDTEANQFFISLNKKLKELEPPTSQYEFFIPLMSKGIALLDKGEFQKAKENFLKAATINNSSPIVHKYLGKTYYKNKEYDKAINELQKSLELNPNQTDIKNSLIKFKNGYIVFKELD